MWDLTDLGFSPGGCPYCGASGNNGNVHSDRCLPAILDLVDEDHPYQVLYDAWHDGADLVFERGVMITGTLDHLKNLLPEVRAEALGAACASDAMQKGGEFLARFKRFLAGLEGLTVAPLYEPGLPHT